MKIRRWLSRLRPKIHRVKLPRARAPYYFRISVSDWRADDNKVKEARAVLNSPIYQEMLSIIQANKPVAHGDLGMSEGRLLGRREGYDLCLELLLALGEFQTPLPEPIQSDFGAEDLLNQHNTYGTPTE